MQIVKMCYIIKYYLKELLEMETNNVFYESIITGYYKRFKRKQIGINCNNKRKRKLIVSMTSIPSRIDKVWLVVESLLRQTYKPDKILLWLAEDEFSISQLPPELIKQQERGLQIRYCENLRSYKKFYYTIKENPKDFIVTVDDDIIYAENMLEKLVKMYSENPGYIICNRSHYIKKINGKLCAYNRWIKYKSRGKIDSIPSFCNFFTSGAGTLFPIFLIDKAVMNKNVFLKLAPYADDVWLNFNAWISNVKTINTKNYFKYIITIENNSKNGLYRINVVKRKNDEQIRQVIKYLKIDINQYI